MLPHAPSRSLSHPLFLLIELPSAGAGAGAFALHGFGNRDLQGLLFDVSTDDDDLIERRRRSGQVTRKLRMLRAHGLIHGLIHELPHTHRYQTSDKVRQVIATTKTRNCRMSTKTDAKGVHGKSGSPQMDIDENALVS
jgi:hypothetical protein